MQDGLRQSLGHGGLKRAVAAAVQPQQATAWKTVMQFPCRLRAANPVQTSVQNCRRHQRQRAGPLQQGGLALAISISVGLEAVALLALLQTRLPAFDWAGLLATVGKCAAAFFSESMIPSK